ALERNHLEAPGVGANGHHAFAGQVLRTFDAKAGLTRVETLVVIADQAGPTGMKEHDVTLANIDALFPGAFLDFLDVEGSAFLDDVGAEVGGHVEQHAARYHRRKLFDTELL